MQRLLFKVLSIAFAAAMILNAVFPNLSNGWGIFLFVASLVLAVIWVFTILRCFRREAIPPSDREFEILSLISIVILLLHFDFSSWVGIAAFVCEAVAAAGIVAMVVMDQKRR